MTLEQAFSLVAGSVPGASALVGDGPWRAYAELARDSGQLASGLRQLGLRTGEHVALVLPTRPQSVVALLAVLGAGGAAVLLNPALRPRELAQVLADLRPSVLVVANRVPGNVLEDSLGELRAHLSGARAVVTLDPAPAAGCPTLAEVAAAGRAAGAAQPAGVGPDDLAVILYTTGTTGAPKGVMHSHGGLVASYLVLQQLYDRFLGQPSLRSAAAAISLVWRYRGRLLRGIGRRTWMTPLPLHSIAGFRVVLQALLAGERMVLMERFHPRAALELIARERVSILAATPAMAQAMLAVRDFERHDLSSLVAVGLGSAPTAPALAREARARFGCPVLIGYGTTETAGGVLVTRIQDADDRQAETVGLPFPGAEVRIVDEHRRDVPPDTPGELACRVSGLMAGYRGEAGATADVVDAEGWYYTGDQAVMDARGYVRIVGRTRDLIIRGGHNVVPIELERAIEEHPDVSGAAVVGVPDLVAGERVLAFVQPAPGRSPGPAELYAHCARRLAPHKLPDRFRIVTELPVVSTGELDRAALRRTAVMEIADGAERRHA